MNGFRNEVPRAARALIIVRQIREDILTIRKLALAAIPAVLAAVGTSSIRVVAQVPGTADAGPVVVTKDGPVRGLFANGVNAYLGIPYAAPPVGDLRWRPPAPPAHHGLIDATQFANTCPQVTELGAHNRQGPLVASTLRVRSGIRSSC